MKDKKILIIITGGIAGYKMNSVVREFVKKGAEVRVILTPSAERFVTKLTFATLSKNEVLSDFYKENGTWNNHIELAIWADVILVAPCTANTLAKMAMGICDNLAMAIYLSARCPIFVAPAMDLDMYAHKITQQNLETLENLGVRIIPAEFGELASGLIGQGRMAEPDVLIQYIEYHFVKKIDLKDKKILITAGPTYEAIDPVRFIGNHSSGKMGYAIANEAKERGAEVILISGPSAEKLKYDDIKLIKVTSAKEVDVAIASAAVADYTPKIVAKEKIKKHEEEFVIELVKNPDILKTMGERKNKQFLVGFALETNNEEENAQQKLEKKNLDMIVLNSLKDKGAGFKNDTNKIKILTSEEKKDFELKSKTEVAKDILDFISNKINH